MSLQNGRTPLHIASAECHKAVVEVLLKAGADHSIKNIVSRVQCILSSSLINFVLSLYNYLFHYSMVTHLYTMHLLMVTRLLLRCY